MSEMRCGVERGETEAEAPPPPAQPQFTCGVQLRRRRETCADIFNNKTLRERCHV